MQTARQSPTPTHVLITGCAGYLGSILTEHLLSAGYHVTGIDNLMYGPAPLLHLAHHPNFEFVKGDASSISTWEDDLVDADVVIPLAAIVGAPACEAAHTAAEIVNYASIQALLDCTDHGPLVIYPNTNSGYGTQLGDSLCTEDTPLTPVTLYGETKKWAEEKVLEADNTIALRLATVFGLSPRMRLDLLVNDFVYKAVTDGYLVLYEPHFKRNYIHVRDVADCFLYCIENSSSMVGRVFNVGLDSANLSKAELADKIATYVPNLEIRYANIGTDPDQRNYTVSNQRLREAGWEASRGLDQGIKELIKGYKMLGRGQWKNS